MANQHTNEMRAFNIEAEMALSLDHMSEADLRCFAELHKDPSSEEQIERDIYTCFLIFMRTRSAEPLERAIRRTEGWIAVTASDHPDRARRSYILDIISVKMASINNSTALWRRMSGLGVHHGTKFEASGSMVDLQHTVSYNELALAVPPARPALLNNLGWMLGKRFELTGKTIDLNRAVELSGKAIEVTPLGHPDRGIWLSNFGYWLRTQFMQTGEIEALNRAIQLSEEAVTAASRNNSDLAGCLFRLGVWRFRRFGLIGMMSDFDRAI